MFRGIGEFLGEVYAEWQSDDAVSLAAALAFYTIFSMAPLLLLVIAIAGLVLGRVVLGDADPEAGQLVHRLELEG